jgi:predicted nucleotide-binding protein (sugar kinase/HSP70/actin superfamily)
MVQLNSFGCGPDSFFMDETGDILRQAGKNHTVLRIDEIAAGGSLRLRLRSMIESLKTPDSSRGVLHTPHNSPHTPHNSPHTPAYTKEDSRKTILVPWFADFISPFIPVLGEMAGYKMENLPKSSKASADKGLEYGNNEVCYPATLVLGDIILALQSGRYDLDNVVVSITQTGGQCRATNYLAQIKAGLRNAGFGKIPVVVISSGAAYQNEQKAFRIPYARLINIIIYALLYADALQTMYSAVIVREKKVGDAQALFDFYIERGVEAVRAKDAVLLMNFLRQAVGDFNGIACFERDFLKVGLIGEIFVKYNNYGQAHITEWLRSKGMEVQTPPALDFLMQYFVNSEVNARNRIDRHGRLTRMLSPVALRYMQKRIREADEIMRGFRLYEPAVSIFDKAKYAAETLDLSNQFGEGWMIAAEVACFARNGVNRVVCIQPFGCIANHVVAKGVERRLKQLYPDMNLLYLDIDGGMAEVNLQNRLHFIM